MIFFDITRLCKRSGSATPSGIDRVDLAYLKWLHGSGSVDYVVNGMSGFTQIPRTKGDGLLQLIESKWHGESTHAKTHEMTEMKDTSHRIRMASKWWRRRQLRKTLSGKNPEALTQVRDDLDLLDVSADPWAYRIDPNWRKNDKTGCFFGISHSMLSRTAYMAALAKNKSLKRVFFIHDTIPCDFPEYCSGGEDSRHLLRIRNAFRYGTHIIVNSEFTKQRLEHWRKLLEERSLPTEVIPIGVDQGLLERTRDLTVQGDTKRPYFVILGTIEPRKNHAILLEVWRHFSKSMPHDAIPDLIIIGKRGWKNKEVFQALDHCEILREHVRELNDVADAELWPLLQGARAMLFPSFVEGWGMPLVEALSLGVPVIASDIAAFHEAGSGVPELVSPTDANSWVEHITAYMNPESSAPSRQRQRLLNYRPPTWQDHFAKAKAFVDSDLLK